MVEARRILDGYRFPVFLHVDPREVHYCKVMLDEIFGREPAFRTKLSGPTTTGLSATSKRWPAKHDNILWYTRDPERFTFEMSATDRIPLHGAQAGWAPKRRRCGKTPTDVWWHTIVSPTGKEKTGYATQKPLGMLERIVRVHSCRGDRVLDFFAGSGTMGDAAAKNGRGFLMVDESEEAIHVMEKRLGISAKRFPVVTPASPR